MSAGDRCVPSAGSQAVWVAHRGGPCARGRAGAVCRCSFLGLPRHNTTGQVAQNNKNCALLVLRLRVQNPGVSHEPRHFWGAGGIAGLLWAPGSSGHPWHSFACPRTTPGASSLACPRGSVSVFPCGLFRCCLCVFSYKDTVMGVGPLHPV